MKLKSASNKYQVGMCDVRNCCHYASIGIQGLAQISEGIQQGETRKGKTSKQNQGLKEGGDSTLVTRALSQGDRQISQLF